MKKLIIGLIVLAMFFTFVLGCVFIFIGYSPSCHNPDGFKMVAFLLLCLFVMLTAPLGIIASP